MSDALALQNALAALTFDRLAPGWRRCTSVFVNLGVTARLERAVETDSTVVRTPPADLAEFEAWSQLREIMADRERGAWLTGRLRLHSSGAYSFDFSWDEEPRWPLMVDIDGRLVESLPVENSELREDMAKYPRDATVTPRWLVERLGAHPVDFSDDWSALLEPLEASDNWSIIREMVRDTVQVLGDDRDAVLDSDVVADAVYNELLASTRASQLMRLLRDAAAGGVVEEPNGLTHDERSPSRVVIGRDDAFREHVHVLRSLLGQLAIQEIANIVTRGGMP